MIKKKEEKIPKGVFVDDMINVFPEEVREEINLWVRMQLSDEAILEGIEELKQVYGVK